MMEYLVAGTTTSRILISFCDWHAFDSTMISVHFDHRFTFILYKC